MRILHFNLEHEFRGGQRQTLLLHQGLLQRDYDSRLLVDAGGLLHAKCVHEQVPGVIPIQVSQWGPPWLKRLMTSKRVKQIVVETNPKVLHFHEPGSLYYAEFFKNRHTIQTRRVSMSIKDISIRHKYKPVDVHVGVSAHVSRHLSDKGLKPVHTVHSSIDLNRFDHVDAVTLKDKRAFNLLYLGAFSQMKGIDVLLNAFAALLKNHKNVALHMVGAGEKLQDYKRRCQQLKIIDDVRFYGRVTEPERYYPEADAVIVPSRRGEGSNGVIKEALASSKVVIASDFEPNLELMTAGTSGVFFKNENSADLERKLQQLLSGHIELNTEAIRQEAMRFSDDVMVNAYRRIYALEFGESLAQKVRA
ncbi:glycosyltransferase family 4 protein [Marinicella sp. W31]|uniref:glycosyltransferase family 4 protein n=1 Tax=Marinicella sp. W31 TaxID=3023713 RepID=UPI00375775DA